MDNQPQKAGLILRWFDQKHGFLCQSYLWTDPTTNTQWFGNVCNLRFRCNFNTQFSYYIWRRRDTIITHYSNKTSNSSHEELTTWFHVHFKRIEERTHTNHRTTLLTFLTATLGFAFIRAYNSNTGEFVLRLLVLL